MKIGVYEITISEDYVHLSHETSMDEKISIPIETFNRIVTWYKKICPIHHIKLNLIDNFKDGDGNKYTMYRCPKCDTDEGGQIWVDPEK